MSSAPARGRRRKTEPMLLPDFTKVGSGPKAHVTGRVACESCGAGIVVDFEGAEDSIGVRAARAQLAHPLCLACTDAEIEAEEAREAQAMELALIRERHARSGVPESWSTLTFDRFDRDERAPAIDAAARWARGEIRGLLLHGRVGRGKSAIAAAAANERCAVSAVRWLSVAELLLDLRRSFNAPEYGRAQRKLEPGPRTALVLDDLDKLAPTPSALQPLYVAVNGWVERRLPLLVTSNRSVAGVADWPDFGEALASRLAGYCELIEVGGPDRRLK